MASFEEVLYKAKSVAETAGKKTADFVEATRLKMNAAEIEKDIAATFEGLGRLIYDGRKDEQDVTSMVDECVLKVDELQAKLDELQRRFDERAAALGRTRKSLLRGNPTARSERYTEVLERLKKRLDTHAHR